MSVLSAPNLPTGITVYVLAVRESDGYFLNVDDDPDAWEVYSTANREAVVTGNLGDYGISTVEQGTSSGIYQVTLPAALDGISGQLLFYKRVGANPSEASDEFLGSIAVGISSEAANIITDSVWDEAITANDHNIANSSGKYLRQIKQAQVAVESSVNDPSPTASSFISSLTSAVDDFYNSQTLLFTSGALEGQSRQITDYVGLTKTVVFEEPLTSAPADTDTFIITGDHVHSPSEISSNILDTSLATHIIAGSVGKAINDILSDTSTDGVVLSASQMNKIADHTLRRSLSSALSSADGDTKEFRSLAGAICKLVNKISISGTTLTITETDDNTSIGTQSLTTSTSTVGIVEADTN